MLQQITKYSIVFSFERAEKQKKRKKKGFLHVLDIAYYYYIYIYHFYINASSLFKLWLAHILTIYISYIKHNANLYNYTAV